jgi:sugar phosphate isomerase/epimerase
MYTSRRKFLQTTTAALAASAFLSGKLFAAAKGEVVGIQLYSIRDEMKKDPLASLKQVSAMGYKHVEHANYVNRKFYGYTPAEFKKILNDLGLKMPSGHTVLGTKHWDDTKKDFTDEWKYTVEDAALLGQKYVISPSLNEAMRKTYDDLMRSMELFNKSGELCKKSGMMFGYHNHDFEFSQMMNGSSVYDIILKNTEANVVMHQLDIGNLYNGGAKAIDIVTKYPGRFKSLHVKDEIKASGGDHEYESTVLGTGIVSVKEVIDLCRKSGGTEHYIIEQEAYQGKTPMESIKLDLVKMGEWGYRS